MPEGVVSSEVVALIGEVGGGLLVWGFGVWFGVCWFGLGFVGLFFLVCEIFWWVSWKLNATDIICLFNGFLAFAVSRYVLAMLLIR